MATTSPESAMRSMKDRTPSVLVRFTAAPTLTTEQYDETIRGLTASGDWMPAGLEYHVAFRSNGDLRISEIWDSREEFDAFRERLMPASEEARRRNLELSGEPEVLEIYNVEKR